MKFTIEMRAGTNVVVWTDGSCRPATQVEVELWAAIGKQAPFLLKTIMKSYESSLSEPTKQ